MCIKRVVVCYTKNNIFTIIQKMSMYVFLIFFVLVFKWLIFLCILVLVSGSIRVGSWSALLSTKKIA